MATPCCSYELKHSHGAARAGLIHLPHGTVQTPAFMPVGTKGAVRALTATQVGDTGAQMVLSNTYHLWERPGHERVARLGGLHKMMGWDRPILTDSGGYQVFSLKKHVKLNEEGVRFTSQVDGTKRFLTPEVAIEIQETLGVDVAMVLDECIEWPASRERVARSTERTTRWLHRALAARTRPEHTAVFGIVQGGTYEDLRAAHAQELTELDLDGYAIGGLSVGEGHEYLVAMAELSARHLPAHKVRYLMGVGYPRDIVAAVRRGVDLFDCVIPTRSARHAQVFTSRGKLNLKNAEHRDSDLPLDPACSCATCQTASAGYLHHLVKVNEGLADTLLTLHNLTYYQHLMSRLRAAIIAQDDAALDALELEATVAGARPGTV